MATITPSSAYKGVVFFTQHRSVTSPGCHYLVLLTDDPNADKIVFGVITSGIDSAKTRITYNRESPDTLVFLSPSDYPCLDHDSVIDCNTPVYYNRYEFERSFGQLNASRRDDIPVDICDRIIQGILASKQVSPKLKSCIS